MWILPICFPLSSCSFHSSASHTMNSLGSYLLYTITVVTAVLHLLLSPASCFSQQQGSDSTRGLLFEEKTRLGSTPPSCHNKCNECHPCMAVQVPTLPSHSGPRLGLTATGPWDSLETKRCILMVQPFIIYIYTFKFKQCTEVVTDLMSLIFTVAHAW
ncbi:unnamed protein product, partial [Vitis vinifera]